MKDFERPDWLRDRLVKRLGRETIYEKFEGRKTAVINVDMQNFFVEEGYLAACPNAQDIVPALNRLSAAVRDAGGPVVWIQTTAEPEATVDWGSCQEMYSPENWDKRSEQLAESHAGFDLWPALEPSDEDMFIKKTRYSCFISGSSNLDEELKMRGVDTVLITGVATNVCCESTARDAMMLNYKTIMVADALAADREDAHANSLAAFNVNFGDVQNVDDIIGRINM